MPDDSFFHRPRISDRGISVVLPVGQPADNVETIVKDLLEHFEKQGRSHEVIVVAEAGAGQVLGRLDDLAREKKRLQLVRQTDTPGRGGALRLGLATAKYPLLLTSHTGALLPGEQIDRLLQQIDAADLVVGRRARTRTRLGRLVFDAAKARLARTVFGAGVRDPWSPVKLYRRAAVTGIPIQSVGDFAEVELVAKANFLGLLIDEVDIMLATAGLGRHSTTAEPSAWHDAWTVFHHPKFRLTRETNRPQRNDPNRR